MAGIFKANNPFNTFLLFVYGLLLKLAWFGHMKDPSLGKLDGFLYKELFPGIIYLKHEYTLLYTSLIYILLFTQAVIFNRIVVNQRLLQKANYLPGMCYLLLTSLFKEWNQLSSVLLITTLLIWCFAKMNKLYNATDPKVLLFNIGFIIGLCSFIYVPSISFSILIAISLIVTRPLRAREWAAAFIGIITPYYFLLFHFYLRDKNLANYKFPLLKPLIPVLHLNNLEGLVIILIVLMLIPGLYFIYYNLRRQVVQVRKNWTILLFYFLIATLLAIFYAEGSIRNSLILLIPLSAFLGSYFFYSRYRFILIASHWIVVAFIIYTGYFN